MEIAWIVNHIIILLFAKIKQNIVNMYKKARWQLMKFEVSLSIIFIALNISRLSTMKNVAILGNTRGFFCFALFLYNVWQFIIFYLYSFICWLLLKHLTFVYSFSLILHRKLTEANSSFSSFFRISPYCPAPVHLRSTS